MGGGVQGHGGVPTHRHMYVHTCTWMHAHVYMYRNCKWLLTWRHPCFMFSMHVGVCVVHVCA